MNIEALFATGIFVSLIGLFGSGIASSFGKQTGGRIEADRQLRDDLIGVAQAAVLAIGTVLIGMLLLAIWS